MKDNKQLSIKYRPQQLSDVVGHFMVLNELENRSKEMVFPQAMLFSGAYGQGKTTLAMIMAKLINCKHPAQKEDGHYEPCGECESCKDIEKESFSRSVHFLDCSTMGKDDVVRLQEQANTAPLYDKNQVFILEEAQELSKAGLGAALKMLEKPRKNVYFILTTMTIGKIDKAIQSRCQHYQLKGVTFDEIADYLLEVLDKESLIDTVPKEFLEEGIFLIAESAEGSMRTAVQMLERCIYGEYWTREKILANFDVIDSETVSQVLLDILKGDKQVFQKIETLDKNSFFWLGWKNLLNAMMYKETGYLKNTGQKRYLDPLIKYESLGKLYSVFEQVYEQGNYVHENHLLGKLVNFVKTPILTRPIQERQPRQRRPRQ